MDRRSQPDYDMTNRELKVSRKFKPRELPRESALRVPLSWPSRCQKKMFLVTSHSKFILFHFVSLPFFTASASSFSEKRCKNIFNPRRCIDFPGEKKQWILVLTSTYNKGLEKEIITISFVPQVEAGDVILKVNGTDVHRYSTKEGKPSS